MNKLSALTVVVVLLVTMGLFSNTAWALTETEAQKLLASDGATGEQFGVSVSVSGDTGLIGAVTDDDLGFNTGSAYVFTRDATGLWTEQAKLLASDGAAGEQFGVSVSVSGDTALIGAVFDDDLGSNTGSAYIFSLSFPVSLINDLILEVMALNLQQGISNSLNAKLDSVLNALEDVNENNDVAAVNSLEAFINAVEAQRGVHLTDAEADQLVTAALQIIDLILSG